MMGVVRSMQYIMRFRIIHSSTVVRSTE